ncbi:MAG: endonuclease/exonuclease/phosphatase family protein [Anaerolineae bacterium]
MTDTSQATDARESANGQVEKQTRGHHPTTHSFHMVTLNTFGVPFLPNTRLRLRTAGRSLNVANLDVVCLQEVQYSRYVPLLRHEFDLLPHAAYEPHVYAPKGGLLTLSRHPLRNTQFYPYKDRRLRIGPAVADWALYKGAMVAELVMGSLPTIIVNTHLIANYSNNWSRHNRYAQLEHAQAQELAELINRLDRNALVLLAGDFNFPQESWVYEEFVLATGMLDPLAEQTKPTFRPPRLVPGVAPLPIDFVFVRPPLDVDVQIGAHQLFEEHVEMINGRRGYISDHNAIRVDVTWSK